MLYDVKMLSPRVHSIIIRAIRWASDACNAVRRRAWLVELLIMVPVASAAHYLWMMGASASESIDSLSAFIWSTLPVLAISNALPMLGATAVLGRYSISDKPAETLKQISDVIESESDRFRQKKGTPLASHMSFKKAMRDTPLTLTFFSEGEAQFVPRPNWDGVWFFPWTSCPALTRLTHEMTYCAIRVIQQVHKVHNRKVALVGGRFRASNGSRWFLDELKIAGHPKIDGTMRRQEALTYVFLAYKSLYYMCEELEAHVGARDLNEYRETEFIDVFCEYMKWLGFFHNKTLTAQWQVLCERYPKVRDLQLPPSIEKLRHSTNDTKKALGAIVAANLPRRATAARIAQVRKGVFLPLIGTAVAALTCLSLKPLAGWQPETSAFAMALAYDMIAASLAANFTFGLWLLSQPAGHVD